MDKQLIYARDPDTGAPWVLDEQPRPIATERRRKTPQVVQREPLPDDSTTPEPQPNSEAQHEDTGEAQG